MSVCAATENTFYVIYLGGASFDLANLHEFISTLTEKDKYISLRDCRDDANRAIIYAIGFLISSVFA